MGELMFDEVGPHPYHFIKNSASHCPDPVPGHFVVPEAQSTERGIYRVLAHRLIYYSPFCFCLYTVRCEP
jgi:hypothetical protein